MAEDIGQFIRDQKAQRQRLLSLLAASPLRVVTGLVHPSGITGSHMPDEQDWTLNLPLIAWRFEDEPVRNTPLTLHQFVNLYGIGALQKSFPPYQIVRVHARVELKTEDREPKGLIEDFLPVTGDVSDLSAAAIELQTPVVLYAAPFGELVLDRSVGWFHGNAEWNGSTIKIQFTMDESGSCDQSLQVARAFWNDQPRWEQWIKEKAVEELLQIKNDHWLDEGQQPITADQFRNLLTIESITANPDGTFEFWCDEGDMFGGHSISITCDLVRDAFRVTLEG